MSLKCGAPIEIDYQQQNEPLLSEENGFRIK